MPFQVLNSGQTAYIQYGALESIVVIINGPNKAKVGVKIGQPPPDSFEYGEASEGFAKKYLLDKKPAIIRNEGPSDVTLSWGAPGTEEAKPDIHIRIE